MKKAFNADTRKNTASIDSNRAKTLEETTRIKAEIMNNKREQNEINHKIVNKFENYTITTEMQEQLDKKVATMHEYFEGKIKWMNTENNRKFTKIIKESLTVPGLVEEFNPDAPY